MKVDGTEISLEKQHPLLHTFHKYLSDYSKFLMESETKICLTKAVEFTNSWLHENFEIRDQD